MSVLIWNENNEHSCWLFVSNWMVSLVYLRHAISGSRGYKRHKILVPCASLTIAKSAVPYSRLLDIKQFNV